MIYLPDVNVWIALTSDQHVHHSFAKRWIQTLEADELAFCRVTELGFLRLLTNAHVMGTTVLKAAKALNIYDKLRADPRIDFVTEQPGSTPTGAKLPAPFPEGQMLGQMPIWPHSPHSKASP